MYASLPIFVKCLTWCRQVTSRGSGVLQVTSRGSGVLYSVIWCRQVTSHGCEVVYTGCPRVRVAGVLWHQTAFDVTAVQPCPEGAEGEARRVCDRESGWGQPDLSECLSVGLRQQEHQVRGRFLPSVH